MEKFKYYAIATIAACSFAVSVAGNKTLMINRDLRFHIGQQQDTLSTIQFINQLSLVSAKEINLSKLAKKKSKNSEVSAYAVKVMDACILLYLEIKPFAEPRNVIMADSTTYVPDQIISVLKKSSTNNFDRQYLSISIEDHNQTIALLEKGTLFGDTAIVSFANKQLNIFRKNLEEATYLSKKVSNHKNL